MTYGNCGDCSYWRDATIADSGDMIGQCRLHPPVFVLGFGQCHWPQTDHYSGCGQNEPLGKAVEPSTEIIWKKEPIDDADLDGREILGLLHDGRKCRMVYWANWLAWREVDANGKVGEPVSPAMKLIHAPECPCIECEIPF